MALTRRTFLRTTATVSLGTAMTGSVVAAAERPRGRGAVNRSDRRRHVVVVGAGAFGGWTALHLLRAGARVTLLDAWGPGNSRASSGGETRVIRGMYGADRLYVEWVVRAFEHWSELESGRGVQLYTPTEALWMFQGDDAYARSSLPLLAEAGLPAREISLARAAERFPQIDLSGVRSVYVEERAGYLAARRACQEVTRAFVAEGGEYRQAAARPPDGAPGRLAALELSDGSRLPADAFVFACGPWLGGLFPEAVGRRLRPTRQEVYFFGTPAGDGRFREESLPTWVDFGERVFYGIPGNEERGFKVADDTHGDTVDPTTLERTVRSSALARARAFLRQRFPDLADAPLVESRVCQYTSTHDGHFLIDRHPALSNAWLVGGGSGHGFKMGPALGEHVARLVDAEDEPLERFSLARLRLVGEAEEKSQLRSGER